MMFRTETSADDAKDAPRYTPKPKDMAQGTLAQHGCHGGWLLLDCLHAKIGKVHKVLEDSDNN